MTMGLPNAAEKYKRPNRGTRCYKIDLIISKELELSRLPGKRHDLIEILRISLFLGSKGTLQHFTNALANTTTSTPV